MSEPEIARRCTTCGASVRQHAMFCPQCGNPVPDASSTTTHAVSETIIDTAPPTPKVPEDGVRGRLVKIREVSSVVLDQAAYDPSLRFLLVAAGLFLLFLLLLIISKVIE
jgi:uncharacterized OB-fold protein